MPPLPEVDDTPQTVSETVTVLEISVREVRVEVQRYPYWGMAEMTFALREINQQGNIQVARQNEPKSQ
jgi:metal-sulfur cluster biosynthetic enzyme